VLDVVLSPEVVEFLAGLPRGMRALTRAQLERLSDPQEFDETTRPLLGAGPEWRIATVGPFTATCEMLSRSEARVLGYKHPALVVCTIDRTKKLRDEGAEEIGGTSDDWID
jgi:hypothetical protein